jgi:hypothetical protein
MTIDCVELSKEIEEDLENLKDQIESKILYFIDECTAQLLNEYEPCPIRRQSLRILFKAFQEVTNEDRDEFEEQHGVIKELDND